MLFKLKLKYLYLFVFFVGFLLLVSLLPDYGLNVDDSVLADHPIEQLTFAFNFFRFGQSDYSKIKIDLEYYGVLIDAITMALYIIFHPPLWFTVVQFFYTPETTLNTLREIISFQNFDYIKFKHLLTLFIGCLGFWLTFKYAKIVFNNRLAGYGASLILALTPPYFGHIFFNSKDIPFAVGMTLGFLVISESIYRFISFGSPLKWGAISGLALAIPSCIRLGSLIFAPVTILIACLAFFTFCNYNFDDQVRKKSLGLLVYNVTFIITLLSFIYIAHPAAWPNYFVWLFDALNYLSKHGLNTCTLIAGEYVPSQNAPWFYIPVWILVITPLATLLLAFVGLIYYLCNLKKIELRQNIYFTFLLLQVFLIPLLAILRHSTLYGGYRHFIFIFPPLAIFSIYGLQAILKIIKNNLYLKFSILPIIILSYSVVIIDLVKLHPYQATYFNETLRTVNINTLFDRWNYGTPMREAQEIANHITTTNSLSQLPIISLYPDLLYHYSNNPQNLILTREANIQNLPNFVYIAPDRRNLNQLYNQQCEHIAWVERTLTFSQYPIKMVEVQLCNNKSVNKIDESVVKDGGRC